MNRPLDEIVPSLAVQVTAVLVVPETVAVNCVCVPYPTVGVRGEIETVTFDDELLTVTDADALTEESAELVAVTVYEPTVIGAVYTPPWVTVPPLADQTTLALVDPLTEAWKVA